VSTRVVIRQRYAELEEFLDGRSEHESRKQALESECLTVPNESASRPRFACNQPHASIRHSRSAAVISNGTRCAKTLGDNANGKH
jgi:hypothetical protein